MPGRSSAPCGSGSGGEVRFDAGSRGAYSTDASNYRQVPIGVVVPRTVGGAVAAVAVCREHGAPVVSRGGGTSLAGQALQHRGRHRLVQVLQPPGLGRRRGEDLPGRAGHRAGRAQRAAGAARADVRAEAGHPRPLHAGRDDRQQLLRVDGAGLRQDRRQRASAGGPALRRRPDVGRADQRRGVRRPSSRRAAGRPRSTGRCGTCAVLRRASAPATRTSRAGSPATTWTPCCPRRASTWPRRWSAARARWSRSCAPS